MDNNYQDPPKKYQSLLDLKKDIDSTTQFRLGSEAWEQEYGVAHWDSRGLWFTKCYMPEEEAIRLAHWILRMTAEQVENNE